MYLKCICFKFVYVCIFLYDNSFSTSHTPVTAPNITLETNQQGHSRVCMCARKQININD